ncbi:MAG: hypothetical protein FJ044_01965 [Candidatus Cloacimonetes bacterium]|nr:hypothetical protein [Candidatus Cloacimonadota bacterium]
MENPNNLSTNYIISTLYQKEVIYFTIQTLADIFNIDSRKASQVALSLKNKNFIQEIEKGKYLLLGFEPERVLSNPFFIAIQIVKPAYISFRSALHHYGLTEQVPFTVYVAATKKKKTVSFEGYHYKYILLSPHKFFGYERILIGDLPVLMADKEKALIDSFDQLRYAGGLPEAAKALFNAKDEINPQRLIDYAIKMKNKSLCSRLGFLLEKYQVETGELEKSQSNSFIRFDPRKPQSKNWNRKWQLDVNIADQELFSWQKS